MGNAQGYAVHNTSLNSEFEEYAPTFYQDGVVFCSNRRSSGLMTVVDSSNQFTTHLYHASFARKGFKSANLIEGLTSFVNEGPACFSADGQVIFFTSNVDRKKFKKKQNRLGIFISEKTNTAWTDPLPLEFNTTDNSFDIAHPALSADGTKLFFSSNMEGGYGATDIYVSELKNGIWQEPKNLGSGVNSAGHELFPTIGRTGKLYFSSNGRKDSEGLDIYYTMLDARAQWSPPAKMFEPLNSKGDDYSMIMDESGESGYFASNRLGNDNVHAFEFIYPAFDECAPTEKPNFCYHLEETEIQQVDTLPFIYYWDFGDGETAEGLVADHCFPDFGKYDISLNVHDTITDLQYAKVSQTTLWIERINRPYISAPDTVRVGELIAFNSAETDMDLFDVDEFFWDLGDGKKARGVEADYAYTDVGTYRVSLGALSIPTYFGVEKTCAYKDIVVINDSLYQPVERQEIAMLSMQMGGELENPYLAEGQPVLGPTKFFVEFEQSDTQIPLNDFYFEKVQYEITERFMEEDSAYHYSVGEAEEFTKLYGIYRELLDSGYTNSMVLEKEIEQFDGEILKRGNYVPKEVREEMNRRIESFSDIRFATNSFEIQGASYKNLDYIVEIMQSESMFDLKINAFTDNTGSDDFNLKLSENRARAVADYLISQGIASERLSAQGFGNTQPKVENNTERGRSINRRVEFVIEFY